MPIGTPGETDRASRTIGADSDTYRSRRTGGRLGNDRDAEPSRYQTFDRRKVLTLEGHIGDDACIAEERIDVAAEAEPEWCHDELLARDLVEPQCLSRSESMPQRDDQYQTIFLQGMPTEVPCRSSRCDRQIDCPRIQIAQNMVPRFLPQHDPNSGCFVPNRTQHRRNHRCGNRIQERKPRDSGIGIENGLEITEQLLVSCGDLARGRNDDLPHRRDVDAVRRPLEYSGTQFGLHPSKRARERRLARFQNGRGVGDVAVLRKGDEPVEIANEHGSIIRPTYRLQRSRALDV